MIVADATLALDQVRYRVVENEDGHPFYRVGHEGICTRKTFSLWAQTQISDGTTMLQTRAARAKQTAIAPVEPPKVEPVQTKGPHPIQIEVQVPVAIEPAPMPEPQPVVTAVTSAPEPPAEEVQPPSKEKQPSCRTFYLTEDGKITREKPEHITKTFRAVNSAEAQQKYAESLEAGDLAETTPLCVGVAS